MPNVNHVFVKIFPTQSRNLAGPESEETRQGDDELRVNVRDETGNNVFDFGKRVILRRLRFDGIVWDFHVMPRVDFDELFLDGMAEQRTGESLDVLQRALALGAGQTVEESLPSAGSYCFNVSVPK
jgi:hypothetical protein